MKTFTSVKSRKISERIAQQIKNAILNGTMKPGDRLPPVRKLVEDFEASHISIREALKSLEASGLLMMKPGSGVFVAELNSQPMGDFLSSILRIHKTSINEITEARIILEPTVARLASKRITAKDLLKLEMNVQESFEMAKSQFSTHAKFIEFHSIIAESTHNLILALTVKTVLDVLREITLEIAGCSPNQVKGAFGVVRSHKKILKALKEKDSQKVYELMMKDILDIQRSFRGFKGFSKSKEETAWTPRND